MPDTATVQETLQRITASPLFANSPRMSRFLRFVVEETAAGRAENLKEYVVGLRVFDKAESFDPSVDTTVRVEASKLRAKLARYYENEGRRDPVVIEIPKGHYAAKFCTREPLDITPAPPREAASSTPEPARATHVVRNEPRLEVIGSAAVGAPASIWRRRAIGFAVVVIVAAATYAVLVLERARSPMPNGRIMLAVLPFQNLTGDSGQEYLCDGLTEEMIAHLGAMNPAQLGVIARTSAMHYKGTTKRADEIGRELGVRYLLETSLRRTGNRMRITAQLIEAQSQSHVWVEQYERDGGNLLALQGEVAAVVSRRMLSSFGLTRTSPSAEPVSANSLAYEHYLRGRVHWGRDSGDELRKAQEHFRKAIELDPTYARAYSGLADTYALLGSYGVMPISESHPLARKAALRALELDDSLAEAHGSLAAIIGDYYWDWADADRHFRRALELGPNDATTLRLYAFHMAHIGHPTEALPMAERACSLDPVSPKAHTTLGSVLHLARRFDDAAREFQDAIDLDPTVTLARALLGLAYISKGMPDRAVAAAQDARALSSRLDVIALHGYVLARAGRTHEALRAIDDLQRLAGPRGPSPFFVGLVYTGLGDKDRAFEWLSKGIDARAWEMPMLKAEPVFDNLRSDPRFPVLLDRIALPS
jgi:TolB-like protein/Tfp pilus assembly protein PilF